MNHTAEVNCTCSKNETVTFVPQGWSHGDIALLCMKVLVLKSLID